MFELQSDKAQCESSLHFGQSKTKTLHDRLQANLSRCRCQKSCISKSRQASFPSLDRCNKRMLHEEKEWVWWARATMMFTVPLLCSSNVHIYRETIAGSLTMVTQFWLRTKNFGADIKIHAQLREYSVPETLSPNRRTLSKACLQCAAACNFIWCTSDCTKSCIISIGLAVNHSCTKFEEFYSVSDLISDFILHFLQFQLHLKLSCRN